MNDEDSQIDESVLRRIAEIAFIVVIFFIVGGTPTPEINEAQYLSKARHFWNPDWCGPDHFLNSTNTHYVFYVTFGWLTQLFSLSTSAWVGRLVGWTLLAWSWHRVSRQFCSQFGVSIIAAGLWLFLIRKFNMAGEWIVGGIEAKTFAYVFVFLGLEALVRNRWNRVWIYFGFASAFHVLVGGWSVVAAAIGYAMALRYRRPQKSDVFPGLLIGGVISLAGVLPVFIVSPDVTPEEFTMGVDHYVFYRLRHHLVPRDFPVRYVARFLVLTALWAVAAFKSRRDEKCWRITTIVIGSLVIALFGALIDVFIGHIRPIASQLLRFYWFRLSDVFVPIGCSLLFCHQVSRLRGTRRQQLLVAAGLGYVIISTTLVF